MRGRVGAVAFLSLWLLCACGSGASGRATATPLPSASPTPTALPTPTPNPHDLVQQYIAVLDRDLASLPAVGASCRTFDNGCIAAFNQAAMAAHTAHADLQQLYAEPASVAPVIEDIRNLLDFGFNTWVSAIQGGAYTLQQAVDFCDGARGSLFKDLGRLKAEAP